MPAVSTLQLCCLSGPLVSLHVSSVSCSSQTRPQHLLGFGSSPGGCAGTVLAATIAARDGGGYGSQGTAQIIHRLREAGIFARPLGNVVYIMVTPTSSRTTCAWLLHELTIAVQAAA